MAPLVAAMIVFGGLTLVVGLFRHHVDFVAPLIIWLLIFRKLVHTRGGYDHHPFR